MFKKTNTAMAKNQESVASNNINIIRSGTTITGDIECNGEIRIDGKLNGNLRCQGKVVVGSSGAINGEVTCRNADISGSLEANIEVKELLSLRATAKLVGDIVTSKLAIEPGASFSGSCNMGGVVKGIDAPKQEEPALADFA